MLHKRINKVEQDVEDIRCETSHIRVDIDRLRHELVDKTPEHFSKRDLFRSFVGSMFLGFSILFSSNLLSVAKNMPEGHVYVILLFTFIVLSAEIYFIGYSKVENKIERKFGQFWLKRIIAFYFVSFMVSLILIYVFGLVYLMETPTQWFNSLIIISTPCAIGASIGDLMKKY